MANIKKPDGSVVPPSNLGFFERVIRTANPMDPFYDAGLAGLIGVGGYYLGKKVIGGLSIDSDSEDKSNFDALLVCFKICGPFGINRAEILIQVHNELLKIHPDYARSFRLFFFPKESEQQTTERLTAVLTALQNADISSRWQDLQKSTELAVIRAIEITREVWMVNNFTEEHPPKTQAEITAMWMGCATVAQTMIDDGRLDKTFHSQIDQAMEKCLDKVRSPEAKVAMKKAITQGNILAEKTSSAIQEARIETQHKLNRMIYWGGAFLALIFIIIIIASLTAGPTNF